MLLNRLQAAEILGCSVSVVERLCRDGKLVDQAANGSSGRRHMAKFLDADLRAIKRERDQSTKPEPPRLPLAPPLVPPPLAKPPAPPLAAVIQRLEQIEHKVDQAQRTVDQLLALWS